MEKKTIEEIVEEFEKEHGFYTGLDNLKHAKDWLRTTLTERDAQIREDAIKVEQYRIIAEIRKLIDWNRDPKNHLDGLKHANTTINALTQAIDRVREPLTVSQG